MTKTTGHCPRKRQPGGCDLHNLHCGYPACDEREAPAPARQEPLPVGEIVNFHLADCKGVSWTAGLMPPIGTKLYAAPQPAPALLTDEQIDNLCPGLRIGRKEQREVARSAIAEFCRINNIEIKQ